jgi:hypothetical protein
MTTGEWKVLLRQWSGEMEARLDPESLDELPEEARTSGWFGAEGADDAEIGRLEARLGRALPPSYRSFLHASDGWLQPDHAVTRLHAAEELDWFAARSPDALQGWIEPPADGDRAPVPDEEYFVYGEEQDPAAFRAEYLPGALEVGSMEGEDFLLLNPQVVAADGEWEAMFLASWLPGAQRYRSFAEAMKGIHADFLADHESD